MSSITFYRGNLSCTFGLHVLLRELKVPHETVVMRFRPTGGYESVDGSVPLEAYLKIHPKGYVPSFVVDGQVITENPAIYTYVGLLAPEKNLLGASQLERTRVVEWMTWFSGRVHGYGFGMYFRPVRFTDDKAQGEEIRARGKEIILEAYATIDKHLAGKTFFVGEAETTVDYYAPIFWYWGNKFLDTEMKELYPNYTQLVGRMESKQSVQDAAKEEGWPLSTA